jgi:hypothetical protein
MAAQGGAAALLDGRHDLQLTEAEVTSGTVPPRRPVGAEDIRDLQVWHESGLRRSSRFQRTDHLLQRLDGHLGIERGGLQLLVSEQNLDFANILPLFE